MTTQHTRGSWKFAPVVQDNKAFTPVFVGCEIRDENGKLIVYLPVWPGVTVSSGDAETIEIAMLIAAAPELLEALKRCAEYLDTSATCNSDRAVASFARTAIAKATGEEK